MIAKLLTLGLCILSFSCATVRVVKAKPGKGGTIALHKGIMGEPAEEQADRIMSQQCPRGYRVIEEGEAVVGSETNFNGTSSSSKTGSSNRSNSVSEMSGSSSTSDVTEWRITYKCKRSRS